MANDPYGLMSGLPPELAAQARGLSQQEAITQALMQQAMSPLPERKRGPHIMEGLAKLAQAYVAGRSRDDAAAKAMQLGQRYQTGMADALQNYMKTKGGDPGRAPMMDPQETEQMADQGTPQPPNVGAVAGDPRKAMAEAMLNPWLRNHPLIAAEMKQLQPTVLGRSMVIPATGETVARDETWQAEQSAAREDRAETQRQNREAAMERLREQIAAREAAGQQSAELRRQLAEMADATRRELAAQSDVTRRTIAAVTHANAPVTPVTVTDPKDPTKTVVVDGRSGRMIGVAPESRQGSGAKPLPAPALRMQQEELDAISTSGGINADLGAVVKQIDSGKLQLGPVRNIVGAVRNVAGMSDENSRNLATFKATLEKLRNDSLRLNKGVQTEGDAQRAWNEVVSNINDPAVVKQRLQEIQKINERAAGLRRMNVDNIRRNYGHEPLDVTPFANQAPAVGGGLPSAADIDAELARRRGGR